MYRPTSVFQSLLLLPLPLEIRVCVFVCVCVCVCVWVCLSCVRERETWRQILLLCTFNCWYVSIWGVFLTNFSQNNICYESRNDDFSYHFYAAKLYFNLEWGIFLKSIFRMVFQFKILMFEIFKLEIPRLKLEWRSKILLK